MQFHWFSPILLIPFALEKKNILFKYIGYVISGILLVINSVIIIIILVENPGLETGA
jgi:hypothetical protein